MQALRSQLLDLVETLPPDRWLVVANLPRDFCGAPMLGKSPFLAVNLRPPFTPTDLTERIAVLEDGKLVNLSGETITPSSICADNIYAWSNELGKFVSVPIPKPNSVQQTTSNLPPPVGLQ